MSVDDDGII